MKKPIFSFKAYWYLLLPLSVFISQCNHSSSIPKGTTVGAPDRYSCPYCDLTEKDFSGQDLSGANLSHANLNGANFSNAILKGTILTGANLENANFQNTSFGKAYRINTSFINSNLTKTNFTGASIASSNFQNADITCANFTNTNISKAIFGQNPVFQKRKDCQPIFKNTIMSCEFPWAWSYFDCSEAKFPDCDNVDSDEWIKTINKARKENETAKWTGEKTLASTYQKPRDVSAFAETYLVTKNGQDTINCGSTDLPCRSIQYAIDRCSTSNAAVLVQVEKFEIGGGIQLKNGVSLFGGYNEDGSKSLYQSEISNQSNSSTIIGINIETALTIHDFILTGLVQSEGNPSILLNNSSGITISNCHITARQGYKGYDGPPPIDGRDGGDGGDGSNSGGSAGAGYGTGADKNTGVFEYANWICTANQCQSKNGYPDPLGIIAKGAPQGISISTSIYSGEIPTSPPPGENGTSATNCGIGGAKSTNIIGTFNSNNHWEPSFGEMGQFSTEGGKTIGAGSGGGGGGGGSVLYSDDKGQEMGYCYGSSGGGGGGPGQPGISGIGGNQGAASFAIFLNNSTLIAGDSLFIIGGYGGMGGQGGAGGKGGNGGKGGAPGGLDDCDFKENHNSTAASGSKGGDGGSAAGGPGGGAGNGGPSIVLVLDNASKVIGNPEYFKGKGGAPGLGGKGGANTANCTPQDGQDGLAGYSGITYKY